MAKIARATQKIFGSSASPTQIVQFGSLAAGTPTTATTPAQIQTLANYLTGWSGAVLGGNSPAIEDMNSLCYLYAYQLAYIMQAGIPEYDVATIYFTGSLCASGGLIYQSLTDNNLGFAVTSVVNWKVQGRGTRTVTANDTSTISDDYLRLDPTGGTFTETLPPIATSVGKTLKLKNISSSGTGVTIKGNVADLIDFANTAVLVNPGDSIEVFNNGTSWDIL